MTGLHGAEAPDAALLPSTCLSSASKQVQSTLVAGKAVGEVAVELKQEGQEVVASFALGKSPGWRTVRLQPCLDDGGQ